MTGVSEGKSYGGLLAWANKEWRNFIDRLEVQDNATYNNLWMAAHKTTDPKSIDPDYDRWRHLVQQAFFAGYEEGFTSRILKGETNGNE